MSRWFLPYVYLRPNYSILVTPLGNGASGAGRANPKIPSSGRCDAASARPHLRPSPTAVALPFQKHWIILGLCLVLLLFAFSVAALAAAVVHRCCRSRGTPAPPSPAAADSRSATDSATLDHIVAERPNAHTEPEAEHSTDPEPLAADPAPSPARPRRRPVRASPAQ